MKKQTYCRFHRFHDWIAFDLDDTETLYVDPQMAKDMAEQLIRYADDSLTVKFTDSTIGNAKVISPE